MRAPSSALVVDSALLIAAARGKSSGAIAVAARRAALVTTDRVVEETRRRIELGLNRPDLLAVDKLISQMTIVPVTALASVLSTSELSLKEAVASRNGSVRDAHVLALAWSIEADIWSTDRDFAGTGVATWSTPNLMSALAETAHEESPP